MSLDQAQEAFHANPNPSTAKRYRAVVLDYLRDGMVEQVTVDAALQATRAFCVSQKSEIVSRALKVYRELLQNNKAELEAYPAELRSVAMQRELAGINQELKEVEKAAKTHA